MPTIFVVLSYVTSNITLNHFWINWFDNPMHTYFITAKNLQSIIFLHILHGTGQFSH